MCSSQLYHPPRGITQGNLAYEMMGYISQEKKITTAHHVDQGVQVKGRIERKRETDKDLQGFKRLHSSCNLVTI